MNKKKLKGYSIRPVCLAWLLIMCLCASCASDAVQESLAAESLPPESLPAEETVPATEEPDTKGPVISGAQALTTTVGGTLSYRSGVTAVDDRDGTVALQIDSSGVDLNTPGEYQVIYSAEDSSGNRSEVVATVVVTEPEGPQPSAAATSAPRPGAASAKNPTLEDVEALADKILAKITTGGMSQRDKAWAIYQYVHSHIKYVGTSDKSSWIVGAYVGFTTGRGDCFNYFACSKALLTRAGIPNVDLQRVGGSTRHYWSLVNVGSGYYHFDPCPHPVGYNQTTFMLTEDEARAFTERVSPVRKNYYVYDYASCPVPVVGLSEAERRPQGTAVPEPTPEVTSTPEFPAEPTPEVTPEPSAEPTPEVTPEPSAEPTPEVTPEPTPEVTPEPAPDPAPEPTVQPEGQEE